MNSGLLAIVLISTSLAALIVLLACVRLPPVPMRGSRGAVRSQARRSAGFRFVEYFLRLGAALSASLPISQLRERIDRRLVWAGDYLGLTADEFMAMVVYGAIGGLVAGLQHSPLVGFGACLIAVVLANSQVQSAAKLRFKLIERSLPGAIDLAAMAMGAGLDFPGSVKLVADNMPRRGAPLRGELERILQELSLGHTRKQALGSFAARVPTEPVREFVSSVVQGEEKGTPLAEVLAIQAGTMRNRRSVLAEEAAAKASVMMMLPMMMLFGVVMILVMGPLVVDLMNGAMG